MRIADRPKAILLLADGSYFYGRAVGKTGVATGEICFNTGMTGYQEIFTDPSYFGQLLLTTTTHIGNYGIHKSEVESGSIKIAGLVCKKFTDTFYSRPSAELPIQTYFERHNLVGISDVDTRAVVRHIRDKGAMNAIISSEELDVEKLKKIIGNVPSMEGRELSSSVSTGIPYVIGDQFADYRVAVIDLGIKKNILKCLAERSCYIKVFPMQATIKEVTEWDPDGIMFSNGPGDPSAMGGVIDKARKLIDMDIPLFGICLGHQIIALANGLRTYKMHHGHRGVNHPVKSLLNNTCEVTSQNHGFVVDMESAVKHPDIEVTHVHLNDNTLAGLRMKSKKVFSVQFHPEASAGPHDSRYLFDLFIEHMKSYGKEKQLKCAN
ncbi:MAG: glutamine-hydrolyzing carbamoyl-phosphate synthase small subunit [Flavobacteriales bacterium]